MAMRATDMSGLPRSWRAALSSRTRWMNSPSVSPTMLVKIRWKWNGEKYAAAATSASVRGSPMWAST